MWSGEKKDERKKGAKREELNPPSALQESYKADPLPKDIIL